MARVPIVAPLAGSIVSLALERGQRVARGELVAVVESMKMEHEVRADATGVVEAVRCAVGDVVAAGDAIAHVRPADAPESASEASDEATARPLALRADLIELQAREALLADASRPEAVAKRHALGMPPQVLQSVVRPGFLVEHVHHDRAVVEQDPPAFVVAFDAHPLVAQLALEHPVDLFADGVQLPAAVAGG